ncbi:phage integrase SAM-like domain-containing protein [Sphingobium cloacae]|uniref:Integrase n=1 Tax=Sphingobium cloacae TaxID=120107 RepID=A0A1E1EXU2_9SPHN|nr:phage integrase SAM-like domain-containing protein [Sphingobium cloacae]BAV63088.1 integrase [Sphingobium cloacae]
MRDSPKRLDKIKANVTVLCEMIDGQMPVHAIDDDVVQRVRGLLAQMPSNRTKLYPGLSLDAAIERAKKDDKSRLSSSTQAHYLEILRDMLKVAVRKKYLTSNPAEEVKPLRKDGVTAAQKRRPWTDQQLREFFMGSSFYRSCVPDAAEPYAGKYRDWRFWLPLLMLFSGARPNEICQLHVDDIARTPMGVWYMSMTDEKDGNSLKTQASRRRVPIQSELIRIGFLQFVDRQKQQGASARLFPMLKPNKYGNLAWYPVKRFSQARFSVSLASCSKVPLPLKAPAFLRSISPSSASEAHCSTLATRATEKESFFRVPGAVASRCMRG